MSEATYRTPWMEWTGDGWDSGVVECGEVEA